MFPPGPADRAILVPSYQAARGLASLLPRLRPLIEAGRVIVVDDGSTDDTARVAEQHGTEVVRLPANAGKGSALCAGFERAAALGFVHCVTMDADGQHAPEDLPAFLAAEVPDRTAVLVGARDLHPRVMPWPRVCSNRLTTFLLGLQAKRPLFDSQCGYRMYRISAVLDSAIPRQGRFEWESQVLVRLARAGWGIGRVPVRTLYGDEESHIRPGRDIARFIRTWWALWWS